VSSCSSSPHFINLTAHSKPAALCFARHTDPYDPSPIQTFLDSDGDIGLGYNNLPNNMNTPFLTLFQNDFDIPYGLFALDFNYPSEPSSLYIGGIPESYRSILQWSNSARAVGVTLNSNNPYHQLTIYDLSLCGENLFDAAPHGTLNSNGGLNAIVNTGASCLTLPAEFFDVVILLLPATCVPPDLSPTPVMNPSSCQEQNLFKYYLSDDIVPILPTISFRVNPNGTWLYLDIATLIYSTRGTYSRGLCLRRGDSAKRGGTIVFGSLAIRSFIVAMNMETFQVAFANKILTNESNVQCVEHLQCQGMQTYFSTLNICEDPPCSSYYFFSFNQQTKTCEMSISFHMAAGFIISLFIFLELGLNEIHRLLVKKTTQTVELS